jgi:hypothetical protein
MSSTAMNKTFNFSLMVREPVPNPYAFAAKGCNIGRLIPAPTSKADFLMNRRRENVAFVALAVDVFILFFGIVVIFSHTNIRMSHNENQK